MDTRLRRTDLGVLEYLSAAQGGYRYCVPDGAYTLLSYFAITIHRRVLWFRPSVQALHVLPLLIVMQVVQMLIQLAVTGNLPSWLYFVQSIVATLVWPIVCWLLLAPQRRAVDRDETRPI